MKSNVDGTAEALTVIDGKPVLDLLLEQRDDVFDDVLLLGVEVLVVLRPVARRDRDEISVLHETSELGAGMDFLPLLQDQLVESFLLHLVQIVLANAGRLE